MGEINLDDFLITCIGMSLALPFCSSDIILMISLGVQSPLYARYLCSRDALGLKAEQRYAKRELGGRCVHACPVSSNYVTYETRLTLYIGMEI